MPLDPQVEELLGELAELGLPALEDCTPQQARENLAARIAEAVRQALAEATRRGRHRGDL